MDDIKWLYKPRWIDFDGWFITHEAVELMQYTKVKVFFKKKIITVTYKPGEIVELDNNGNKITQKTKAVCFSWNWLLLEIVKDIRNAYRTKWWTHKSFKKDLDKGVAKCPKCGKVCFDID